jgi:VIT1/CCC1 family predicted Fe2+/Mn2+ transporter
VGKDYLNLYLREIILMNTFKSLFDTKLSDQKFSYLTKSILNDEISATNILTSSLNSIDEDIARNEDLLLLYNKDEVEIEYTLDSKN